MLALTEARPAQEPRLPMRGRTRTYLLTGGLAVCGRCGTPLEARPSETGRRSYVCSSARGSNNLEKPGCGRIRVVADSLEDYVAERILARLASRRSAERVAKALIAEEKEAHAVANRLDKERARLDIVAADWADGKLGHREFYLARDRIAASIKADEELLDRAAKLGGVPVYDPEQLADWWNTAGLERRRALLTLLVDRIEVGPTTLPGSRKFDPARVRIVWK